MRCLSQTVDLSNRAVAPSGRESFNLILSAGALTPGERYSFRLDVNTTSPSGKGLNEVVFLVNTVRNAAVRQAAHVPRRTDGWVPPRSRRRSGCSRRAMASCTSTRPAASLATPRLL